MDKEMYLINFLEYYEVLEEDLNKLKGYIDLSYENYNVISNQIAKQLVCVGDEFKNLCKVVDGIELGDEDDIKDYRQFTLNEMGDISEIKINVKNSKNITLKPFNEWSNNNNCQLFWWNGYNKLKNNRIRNFKEGNLKNLLNAISALYFMEIYLAKKTETTEEILNYAANISKIFEIDDDKFKINDIYDDNKKKCKGYDEDFEEAFWDIR